MSKPVKVTYRQRNGEVITEINLLVDQSESVKVDIGDMSFDTGFNGFDLSMPNHLLLEDDFGLWSLDAKDLISLVFITEEQYESFKHFGF